MNASERKLFDRITAESETYFTINDKIVETFRAGTSEALWQGDQLAVNDSWNTYYRILRAAQQLAHSVDQRSQQAVADSADAAASAQRAITIGAALALLLGCLLAFLVTRSIVAPVTAARTPCARWRAAAWTWSCRPRATTSPRRWPSRSTRRSRRSARSSPTWPTTP
nr:hypothetical protein GCM10020093_117820 [Planobispora longispora]